jgi:glycosyltransferase involved in cell wall biosynthesis
MGTIPRLAIFTTHPIQYQVPWFRALQATKAVDLTVYYGRLLDARAQGEGFGVSFTWDLPLFDGYRWAVAQPPARNNVPRMGSFLQAVRSSDVVLVTGWHAGFVRRAAIIARLAGRPLLLRGESNALRSRPVAVRTLHHVYLRLFSCVLSIGSANDEFYARNGVPASRRVRCPYFVDNDRFIADAERLGRERATLRDQWAIPPEAFCFLFAGKLIEKKRPLDILRALSRMRDRSAPVHLLVVGEGALRAEAQQLASCQRLPITFAGFLNQTEIGKAYAAADALVLPSDCGETWGLVVNEAMLFGCPAVVSDRVGCRPDLVLDGETGFSFPFGDEESLGEAMTRLASDPEQARQMGDRARDRILRSYSVEAAVQGTLSAVSRALGGRF